MISADPYILIFYHQKIFGKALRNLKQGFFYMENICSNHKNNIWAWEHQIRSCSKAKSIKIILKLSSILTSFAYSLPENSLSHIKMLQFH